MKPSLLKIINALRRAGRKGINFAEQHAHFPVDYRKRLSEARDKGFVLGDMYETLSGGCRSKRYWIIKEPKLIN